MMSTLSQRGRGDVSLLTLSSIFACIGILCLLIGGVSAFFALHTLQQGLPETVPVRLGDSAAIVKKYLGSPQSFQKQSLFDLDGQGYPHYMVQIAKNNHVYSMLRELWPEEQQEQTLSKQDCLAMLPSDAKFSNAIASGVPGYPDAENYTSVSLKKVFAGYTFSAPAGDLEMIYRYRQVQKQENGQVVSTMQILLCQVGMGRYTGNSV